MAQCPASLIHAISGNVRGDLSASSVVGELFQDQYGLQESSTCTMLNFRQFFAYHIPDLLFYSFFWAILPTSKNRSSRPASAITSSKPPCPTELSGLVSHQKGKALILICTDTDRYLRLAVFSLMATGATSAGCDLQALLPANADRPRYSHPATRCQRKPASVLRIAAAGACLYKNLI